MPARPDEYARQQAQARALGYSSYYELRSARAAERGFANIRQQTVARAAARNDFMYSRFHDIAKAGGKSERQILNDYLKLKRESGGKQPSRNKIKDQLVDYNVFEPDDDYDPYP